MNTLDQSMDKIRAALQKEAKEELLPYKRKKRKHKDNEENDDIHSKEESIPVDPEVDEEKKLKPNYIILENKEAVARLKKNSSIWSKFSTSSNDLKIKNNVQPNKMPILLFKPTPKVEKKAFSESKTDSLTKVPKNTASKINGLDLELQKMKAKQAILICQLKEKELAMKRMEVKKKKEAIAYKQMCAAEKEIVKKPLPPPPKKKVVPSINKSFKQCDEDDYGYLSQEASAFSNKLLNKCENMPPEPPKFEPTKREVKDLKAAKDRVRAAEPERFMTKKQKLASCKKSKQARMGENPFSTTKETSKEDLSLKKIPKSDIPKPKKPDDGLKNDSEIEKKQTSDSSQSTNYIILVNKEAVARLKKNSSIWSKFSTSSNDLKIKNNVQPNKMPILLFKPTPKVEKKAFSESKTDALTKAPKSTASKVSDLDLELQKMKAKQAILICQLKEKELGMKRMEVNKKKEAIVYKKMKCEPERKIVKKPLPPPPKKKVVPSINKRCIDSAYDSQLLNFVDDWPDDGNDLSKLLNDIFGYDMFRYANIEDEHDECMESNFAQISKEEYVSTKIGIMEDLEDIRKELEEK